MDFIAIDVETANPRLSSICQIGIVAFEHGRCVGTWQSLIDPADYFDPVNVSIHGITEEMVEGAPIFADMFEFLRKNLQDRITVCHTPFDRLAMARACGKWRLPEIDCTWLDSARVVRRAWQRFARRGYGLSNITQFLGIVYEPHVAKEDARAAGEVVLRAIAESGMTVEGWVIRASQPICPRHYPGGKSASFALDGNPDGPLAGEVAVFTGALAIPRREAAEIAATLGCAVRDGVTKETTLLIVGDQDLRKLAGHDKSLKHRKAEKLISGGQHIRILAESDFQLLSNVESGESSQEAEADCRPAPPAPGRFRRI